MDIETIGLRNEWLHLKPVEETCMVCSDVYGKLVWGPRDPSSPNRDQTCTFGSENIES